MTWKEKMDQMISRRPRLVAHVIAYSIGYATPRTAAAILADAQADRPNLCEWCAAMWGGNARALVEHVIANRHYIDRYSVARARFVIAQAQAGRPPVLASWM